jgi:hypothetical protein
VAKSGVRRASHSPTKVSSADALASASLKRALSCGIDERVDVPPPPNEGMALASA